VVSVTSNDVDGQLPPVLNVRTPTSGRHHLARQVKASEPSVKAAIEKVKEKERKFNILGKL